MKHLIILLALLFARPAIAADVVVSWPPPENDMRVTGYNIYYGPNNPPAETVVEVDGIQTSSVDITGLPEEGFVYFGATSRDADGRESAMSDIVQWMYEPEPETIYHLPRPGGLSVKTVTTTTTTTTVE